MRCEKVLMLVVASVISCSAAAQAPAPERMHVHTVAYPHAEKFPLKIVLVLPKELRDALLSTQFLARAQTFPLGMQLAHNAEGLARHLFADVVIAPETGQVGVEVVDAVLTPRLAYAQQLPQPWSDGRPPAIVIAIEWTLRSMTGAVIWTETVRAESRDLTPRMISDERVRTAIDRAFHLSYFSMAEAPAIKTWRPKT